MMLRPLWPGEGLPQTKQYTAVSAAQNRKQKTCDLYAVSEFLTQ